MQGYRPVKLVEGSGICSAILDFPSLVPTSGRCSLQSPFWVTVKSCFERPSGAGGSLAAVPRLTLPVFSDQSCAMSGNFILLGLALIHGDLYLLSASLSTDSIIGQSFITKLDLVWLDWEVARSWWERPAWLRAGCDSSARFGGGYW